MQPLNNVKREERRLLQSRVDDFVNAGGVIQQCTTEDNTNHDATSKRSTNYRVKGLQKMNGGKS